MYFWNTVCIKISKMRNILIIKNKIWRSPCLTPCCTIKIPTIKNSIMIYKINFSISIIICISNSICRTILSKIYSCIYSILCCSCNPIHYIYSPRIKVIISYHFWDSITIYVSYQSRLSPIYSLSYPNRSRLKGLCSSKTHTTYLSENWRRTQKKYHHQRYI
jgi:hypothetical protein